MAVARSEEALKTLMLLSLDGDEVAYRHLLKALRPLLAGYYDRRMSAATKADMEDLIQETLLALHTRRSTYDRTRPFTSWFFSVARYKLIDHYRGRGGRMLAETELGNDIDSGFSEEVITARMDVERLLDSLPPKQRDLIRRVKLEGQSVADTAS